MSKTIYSNIKIKPDTYYFLYIGELKSYGLNFFLKDFFQKLYNKKVDFIAIVSDFFDQYYYKNLIVINPEAEKHLEKTGKKVCCRIDAKRFMKEVSNNDYVQDLIQTILRQQNHLYIYMYESLPEMTLDQIDGVSVLGPKSNIAHKLNNKIFQYKTFNKIVPMPDFDICQGLEDLLAKAKKMRSEWEDGIFISQEYSAAGSCSAVTSTRQEILKKFDDKNATYLISRYIPHEYDPTVLAIVANENDVYIAGVADQCIVDGNRFVGSTYPSVLPDEIIKKLKEYTVKVGQHIGKMGYRGIYGCDYIVVNDNIYFMEINSRKQGTTMEFCCTLEQLLPKGSPMLPELEYYAVKENRFPSNTIELKDKTDNIYWGTYNMKINNVATTDGYIPQDPNEREVFKKVANKELKKDFIIMEHIGNDFIIKSGTFLGRIVSVANNREDMLSGIEYGKRFLKYTVKETFKI